GSPTSMTHAATYPPFTAMLFVPLSLLRVGALAWIALVVNIGLLVLDVRLSFRLAGLSRASWTPLLPAAAICLWAEPIFTTLSYGQINLAVLALVLWAFTCPAGSRAR